MLASQTQSQSPVTQYRARLQSPAAVTSNMRIIKSNEIQIIRTDLTSG